MDPLDVIKSRFPLLDNADLMQLAPLVSVKQLLAGETLIRSGTVDYRGALVLSGLLRNYHPMGIGKERTVLFIAAGGAVAAYASVLENRPAVEQTQALEDSTVLLFDMRQLRKLMDQNQSLQMVYTKAVEQMLLDAIRRIDRFVLLSPEQRYLQFLTEQPDLEQRIPQKYLASYLGITPISLSRMRNRMARRKLT